MESTKINKEIAPNSVTITRNYQIDFLKFVLAVIVFFCHTIFFIPQYTSGGADETSLIFHHLLGYVSVMCFFIVSGFFMIKTIAKGIFDCNNPGKKTIQFVIGKFRKLALPFWISSLMYLSAFLFIYLFSTKSINLGVLGNEINKPTDLIVNVIPQIFCLPNVGEMLYHGNNSPTWYISAMLLVMIPVCYLLITKRDLFVYVLSPLIAIIALGYLKGVYDPLGLESGNIRLIRACCGICFGILAWTIYNKLVELSNRRSICIMLTLLEIVLYAAFFAGFLTCSPNYKQVFPLLLLFPVAMAITLSGKSYVHKLFKAKWLKCLGNLSLYIYLNHYLAVCAVRALFDGKGYWLCTIIAAILTAVSCGVCYLGVVIIKKVLNKICIIS